MLVASFFATVGAIAGADVHAASVSAGGERRPAVDDTQVALAKLNLLVFLLGNVAAPGSNGALDVPCPLLRADQVTALAAQQQLVADVPNFDGVTVYHDTAIGDGVSGVACGRLDNDTFLAPSDPAAPLRVGLDAFTIDDSATFADTLLSVTGGSVVVADVPAIGGELGGRCTAVGTSRHCAWEWHRDGLVLGLFTFGPTSVVDEAQSQQLLISMVQPMIDNLVAYTPAASTRRRPRRCRPRRRRCRSPDHRGGRADRRSDHAARHHDDVEDVRG